MRPAPLVLRLALRAYPRPVRVAEADVLLGLALELIDAGAPVWREATGLVGDGLRVRFGRHRLGRAPWRPALGLVGVPLAAALLGILLTALAERLHGVEWIGWYGALAVGATTSALAGLALGRRRPAVLGATVLLGLCAIDSHHAARFGAWVFVEHETARGLEVPVSISFDVMAALVPAAAALLACAFTVEPRPGGARSLAWGLAGALCGAVAVVALGRPLWWDDHHAVARSYVSGGALALGLAILLASAAALRARTPAARLAAALALACVAVPAVLGLQSALPAGESSLVPLAYLLVLGGAASFGLLRMARATASAQAP